MQVFANIAIGVGPLENPFMHEFPLLQNEYASNRIVKAAPLHLVAKQYDGTMRHLKLGRTVATVYRSKDVVRLPN
jgi:hypothetical protein